MDLLKLFISLLALVNPIGAIPIFVSLTPHQTEEEKRSTVKRASISVTIVIIVTAFFGRQIISFLGISIAALQVAAGISVLLMGLNMLNAQLSRWASKEEEDEAGSKNTIAVVPLAIPLLTGPATMGTIIIYADQLDVWYKLIPVAGLGIVIGALVWGALSMANPIVKMIGHTGINIGTRLMGLILMALAIEFMMNGLKELLPGLQ